MHYLVGIGAMMFFAFIAPRRVTAALIAVLLVTILVVKAVAERLAGMEVSVADSAKGVLLSAAFLLVGALAVSLLHASTGIDRFVGAPAIAIILGLLAAFALGFKVAIGLSTGATAVVSIAAAWCSHCGLLRSGSGPALRNDAVRPTSSI